MADAGTASRTCRVTSHAHSAFPNGDRLPNASAPRAASPSGPSAPRVTYPCRGSHGTCHRRTPRRLVVNCEQVRRASPLRHFIPPYPRGHSDLRARRGLRPPTILHLDISLLCALFGARSLDVHFFCPVRRGSQGNVALLIATRESLLLRPSAGLTTHIDLTQTSLPHNFVTSQTHVNLTPTHKLAAAPARDRGKPPWTAAPPSLSAS